MVLLLLLLRLLFAELVEEVLLLDLLQRRQLAGLEVVATDGGGLVQAHAEEGVGLHMEYAVLVEYLGQAELRLLRDLVLVLNWVGRLLDHVIDHSHSGLRVDGTECVQVGGPRSGVQEVGEHVSVIADKEGVRHVGQLLGVLLHEVERRGVLVGDDVIHVVSTTGARVS